MLFRHIYDTKLAQYAYLIGCQQTGEALIIDPERDIDRYLTLAEAEGLTITAVAETHIHADFLSGAREFADRLPVTLYLSDEGDSDWKYEWATNPKYSVRLLKDGDVFRVGNIEVKAMHTPGHTPEHLSFLVTDRGGGATEPIGIATGDFVFVQDLGRPDLLETAAGVQGAMEPSARRLYQSAKRFMELPDFTQVWPAHGAGTACGKAPGAVPASTVGYERRFNQALNLATADEGSFVEFILTDQPEPPLYFARMKKLNKEGPPVLGVLPTPRRIVVSELDALVQRRDVAVVDTRVDREAFLQGHVPGSLYAPYDKTFPTIVGSYVEPEQPVYLVIHKNEVEAAVRDLVRIGYDNVAGFVTPETLERYERKGGELRSTPSLDFAELERRRQGRAIRILDVRSAAEHRSGHIPEAQNIAHTQLRIRIGEVPRNEPVIVHCGSGARAAGAVALLEREGFEVTHVNDAFANWKPLSPTRRADLAAVVR